MAGRICLLRYNEHVLMSTAHPSTYVGRILRLYPRRVAARCSRTVRSAYLTILHDWKLESYSFTPMRYFYRRKWSDLACGVSGVQSKLRVVSVLTCSTPARFGLKFPCLGPGGAWKWVGGTAVRESRNQGGLGTLWTLKHVWGEQFQAFKPKRGNQIGGALSTTRIPHTRSHDNM